MNSYQAKKFKLSGLNGISDQTLEMHFKLYEGYVKETNVLQEKITAILEDGKVDQEEMPAYSELKRRLGFEYNGMVLHEYYFGNLKKGGGGDPQARLCFRQSDRGEFWHLRHLEKDFVGIGKMRGVGWAIYFRIRRAAVYPTIGSPYTRSVILPATPRC